MKRLLMAVRDCLARMAGRRSPERREGRGMLLPGQVPGAGWWPAALPGERGANHES